MKQLNAELVSRLGRLLKDMKSICTTNSRVMELMQCLNNASDSTDVLRSLKGTRWNVDKLLLSWLWWWWWWWLCW